MTVVGISMVRDEADIIHSTVAHMLDEVDAVIVLDNGSVDGTRDILDCLDCEVVDDPEVAYYQGRKMTALARRAREQFGADWVVPFDADEWWYSPHGRIGDVLDKLDGWHIAAAELHDHVATGQDPDELDPVCRMGWRRVEAAPLPKVACRPHEDLTIDQGNHGAYYDAPTPIYTGALQVRHFPYRSAEQFARKAKNGGQAYAATDLDESVGQHWREYARLIDEGGDRVGHDIFRRWFWVADPEADSGLIFDPVG